MTSTSTHCLPVLNNVESHIPPHCLKQTTQWLNTITCLVLTENLLRLIKVFLFINSKWFTKIKYLQVKMSWFNKELIICFLVSII